MAEVWVYHDGQRLTPAMLADFQAMNAEFFRRTRCYLRIRSGVRTDPEQERFWYDRMVLANQVLGRRVYETRWWNGKLWYRISSAGTVAPPGQSNHQINLAAGRYGALDLYDTGSDAGILTRGSFRARVFDEIAPRYGYDSEGYAFGENWHKRYNRNPYRAVSGTITAPRIPEEDDMSIAVYLNNKHFFHLKFGGIKHMNNNTQVAGFQGSKGPAHLTMLIVTPDDKWIPLNSNEFLEQLDNFHIPRSVVDLNTGFVLDVARATEKNPKGEFVSGGAWEWARAAYANTLVEKPVPRY